jgi:hypothetical protein
MPIDRINRKFFLMSVNGQRIGKNTDNDIAVRCPICGDSKKNKRSTRLHLYTKDGYDGDQVSCFNGDCPVQNKTVYSFLKNFFPSLLEQYKRENFSNKIEKLSEGDVFESLSKSNKTSNTKDDILLHDLTPYLRDISEVPEALEYIKGRKIQYSPDRYGQWYFGYQDLKIGEKIYKITDSVVIPLYKENKMYGFYSRSIKSKEFYTYNPDANVGYKVWNWFNIKKDEPVFIFEGIFDAISGGLPNSIAMMGAKIPAERLKELKKPIFVLDDDKTGRINSINYANMGYDVFVQPHGYAKDMNANLLNGVDTTSLILNNIYGSISAITRIKSKM